MQPPPRDEAKITEKGRTWGAKARAMLVLRLLRGELKVEEAARVYGLPVRTVEYWKRRFVVGGETALRPNVRLEQALKESEERYRVLFDSCNDPIFLYDLDDDYFPGRISEANPVACETLGYVREELLQLTALDIRAPDAQGDFPFVGRTLARKQRLLFETTFLTREGRQLAVEVSARMVRVRGRRAVLSIARDLSTRRQGEETLRQAVEVFEAANRYKSELLANLSHELRTPLGAILGYADLLLDGLEGDLTANQHKSLGRLRRNAADLGRRLDALLDLSAAAANTVALANDRFDPREVVAAVVHSLAPRAVGNQVELVVEVGGEVPPRVIGDRKRLEQVWFQLVDNAIKFGGPGRVTLLLAVGAQRGDDRVELHGVVADRGPGVAASQREMIFRAFVQGNGSATRLQGGVGLGLAVARHTVELLGGRIWVESAEGQGARFHFTANFSPADDAAGPCPTAADGSAPNSQRPEE